MEEKDLKHNRRTQVVSILGPLITLISAIVAVWANTGPAIRTVALLVVVLVAAWTSHGVLGRPFVLAVRNTCRAKRERSLAPEYLMKLGHLVKKLQRLSDRNHSDNVASVLCKFPPLWGGPFREPVGLSHIIWSGLS